MATQFFALAEPDMSAGPSVGFHEVDEQASAIQYKSIFKSMLSAAKIMISKARTIDGSVCTILLYTLLATYPATANGQVPASAEFESSVNAAFHKIRTITFAGADSVLIGVISTIDVGSDGRLVITDEVGEQAILFEGNGNFVAHLEARLCNPGVVFYPTGAKIKPDSSVLVLGTSPWGFLFDKYGLCKSSLSTDFVGLGQNELVLDGSDKMIGMYDTGTGHVLRFMNDSGQITKEVSLPISPAPGVDYRWAGGGLVKTEKYLYFAVPSSSALTQLDLEGRPVQVFESKNSWFRPINRDVPDPFDSISVDRHMRRIVQNRSMVDNVLLLDHDLVMIQYHNGDRRFGLQVFDEAGNLVTEILGVADYFHHAYDGLAYRVVQPDIDERGNLPNPYVEVYEYRVR